MRHASMMGISTEGKYLIKSLRENKKYGGKRLLKMFLNKNWSLGGLKALIKKLTTLLFDVGLLANGRPRTVRTLSVLSIVFYQRFQSTKTPVFVSKHLSDRFAPYFLFSRKDSAISHH